MIADVSFRASTTVTKCQIVSLDSCEVPIMSRPQTNRTWNEHLPSVVRFPLSSVHEVAVWYGQVPRANLAAQHPSPFWRKGRSACPAQSVQTMLQLIRSGQVCHSQGGCSLRSCGPKLAFLRLQGLGVSAKTACLHLRWQHPAGGHPKKVPTTRRFRVQ